MKKEMKIYKLDALKLFFGTIAFFIISQDVLSQTTVVSYDFNDLSVEDWEPTLIVLGTWEQGVDILNEGSDGTNYWYTSSLSSGYTNDADFAVTTADPINFGGFYNMSLSIDIRYDTESDYDGFQVQYSIDGGSSYTEIGNVGEGLNWYNDGDVNAIDDNAPGWSGDNGDWHTAVIGLPSDVENVAGVLFRVRFKSDDIGQDTGVAFDNFVITSEGAEIHVTGNDSEISDGDTTPSEVDNTDFSFVAETSGSRNKTFFITNTNGGVLNLTGASPVSISGTDASDFSVVSQPGDLVLEGGESTFFVIGFDPSTTGVREALVTINNADSDENPYTFAISGYGVNALHVHNFNSDADGWSSEDSWTLGVGFFSNGADGAYWRSTSGSGYASNAVIEIESSEIDLTGEFDMVLYMDVRYDTETDFDGFSVQYSVDAGGSWNELGDFGEGDNWYDGSYIDAIANDGWSGDNTIWQTAEIDLPVALENNASAQFKVTFKSSDFDNDLGVAFDNFMIAVGVPDIMVSGDNEEIVDGQTALSYTDLTDFRNVDVTSGIKLYTYTIQNRGGSTLNLTTVSLTGSSDFTVESQPADLSLDYLEETTFIIAFDPSTLGEINATISIGSDDGDEDPFTFDIAGTGDNALYYHNFDATQESWTVDVGNMSGDWLYGSAILNSGASGSYWYISPSTYSANADLIVESPTLDLSTAIDPLLSIDVRYDTESGADGLKIEYSDDDGTSWFDLGQINQDINWYNDTDVDGFSDTEDGWSGDNAIWQTAEIELPDVLIGNPSVRMRLMFASNGSVSDVGVAFDNFAIYADAAVSLPVELLSFKGVAKSDGVLLSWVTGAEINNDFFEIQRSFNTKDFYTIGTVKGNGNSSEAISYEFKDFNPSTVGYYRLRQVDFDGLITNHEVIRVDYSTRLNDLVIIYPNPYNHKSNNLTVILDDNIDSSNVKVSILGVAGHAYFTKEIVLDESNKMTFGNELPYLSGLYFFIIEYENTKIVKKLIIE